MMRKASSNYKAHERAALILARGAVSLILIIAIGNFGRSFYLAIRLGEDYPISDAATQLLTAMGSALMGGAVGYIGGASSTQIKEEE